MSNALAQAMSPYLRQHADNPVDWVEWSPAAFEEARRRDVPVLVSIGYATCHWCHVMAHESFEDEATARKMNAELVCIKVDREELPEVDEIYMDAVQALSGHGGWPLNAFLDHDGRPFFAGTYFARDHWNHLVSGVADAWRDERAGLMDNARTLTAHLGNLAVTRPGTLPTDLWARLDAELEQRFDAHDPGWSHAPKFPPSQLLVLLASRHGAAASPGLAMAERVLEAMQDSGLHDRVGGGFHRYSTDSEWRVPHFEKMLYDQAQLIVAYALAGARLARADFMRSAESAARYLVRDLRVVDARRPGGAGLPAGVVARRPGGAGLPAGVDARRPDGAGHFLGYASAEDADDPNGEGSFYAWSPDALRDLLGERATPLIAAWDLHAGTAQRGRSGHLEPVASHIPQPRARDLEAVARDQGHADAQALRASWEADYPLLLAARASRPRPIRDDKVLTDLNGLTLVAFATLARLVGDPWPEATRELADMLLSRLGPVSRELDGLQLERLPGRPAFVTDYGHLALGFVESYRALGDPSHIAIATALVDTAQATLGAEGGGFYTTPAGRTDLVRRSLEHADHAYPAGAHALALAAVRLYHLTEAPRMRALVDGVLQVRAALLGRAPSACPTLLQALWELEQGPITVVVAGHDARALALIDAARRAPRLDVLVVPVAGHDDVTWPVLDARRTTTTQAWLCQRRVCRLPTDDVAALTSALDIG